MWHAYAQISLESSDLCLPKNLKNKLLRIHIPQPPSLESKSKIWKKDPKEHGMHL
jgi:hypothetical protein